MPPRDLPMVISYGRSGGAWAGAVPVELAESSQALLFALSPEGRAAAGMRKRAGGKSGLRRVKVPGNARRGAGRPSP